MTILLVLLVILIIICIILCYALYAFVQRKKLVHYDDDPVFEDETVDATKSATQAATNPSAQAATQSAAEAVSYIEDMKQLAFKMGDTVWQQYDILLATRGYGWDDIIEAADYLASADMDYIDSISTSSPTEETEELVHAYRQSKGSLKDLSLLAEEKGSLGLDGHSRKFDRSLKIVWYNQTRVLRIFSMFDDAALIREYVETMMQRAF